MRQIWPSRLVSACSFSTVRLNLVLTHGIAPGVHGGVHIFSPHTIGSVQGLSGRAIAYRYRSLPRVRWHRARIVLNVVRVTGAAFASPWTNYYRVPLSFPTPTTGIKHVQIQNISATTAVLFYGHVSPLRLVPVQEQKKTREYK